MEKLEEIQNLITHLSADDLKSLNVWLARHVAEAATGTTAASRSWHEPGGREHFSFALEFCDSNAANFSRALAAAKGADAYFSYAEGKRCWHVAAWREQDIRGAAQLAELLSGQRNKRCYVDGVERHWEDVFGFVSCAAARGRAYKPESYCFGDVDSQFNPWGCVQAKLDWTEWASWFKYGRFERTGFILGNKIVWKLDKGRIRHELLSNLRTVQCCPHLQMNFVEAVIAALPEEIEVKKGGDWKYIQAYEEKPGSVRIVEVQAFDGYEVKNEFFAVGVGPNGSGAYAKLLHQAARKCGIRDISVGRSS